jgi:signal transduction histidine kinase
MTETDPTEALRECEETLVQLQKMESIGQMTGRIAHDFNNQLQNIVAALELVRKLIQLNRVGETERFLTSAVAAAQRAAAMNQRLGEFARRQPLAPWPNSLSALVSDMDELLRTAVPNHVQLELDLASDLWQARCDANQAKTAILNLVLNAADAIAEKGTVTIQTRNEGAGSVRLTVTDSGKGMSREVMDRAREKFFTTKPSGVGIGLGLTMVDRFAKQSEGEVTIDSEEGRGTSVSLRLPAIRGG